MVRDSRLNDLSHYFHVKYICTCTYVRFVFICIQHQPLIKTHASSFRCRFRVPRMNDGSEMSSLLTYIHVLFLHISVMKAMHLTVSEYTYVYGQIASLGRIRRTMRKRDHALSSCNNRIHLRTDWLTDLSRRIEWMCVFLIHLNLRFSSLLLLLTRNMNICNKG